MTSYDGDGQIGKTPSPQDASPTGSADKKKRRRRRGRRRGKSNASVAGVASVAADQQQSNVESQSIESSQANKQKVDQPASVPGKPNSNKARQNGKSRNFHTKKKAYTGKLRTRPAYAALDLGTNNCRLLVAVPDGTSFRVVDAFSRIVRLGEGMSNSGRLSNEAMDRAVEALKVCAQKLKGRNIKRFRLIATEACRIAENGEEFIERVREEAGLELEIVNRETEARLAVAGCAPLVDRQSDGVIIFDIGGGSSELVWLDLKSSDFAKNRIARRIRTWTSLPVGVVNISERHGGVHVTPPVFEGMVEEVIGLLDDFPEAEALSAMVAKGEVHMLGTSGTVTTLAGVHLGLDFYDRSKVDGIWMSSKDVGSMTQKLLEMSFEERSGNACIGRERADLVLAGCAILEALRRKWPCNRMRVADRGLREGILYELMNEDGVLKGGRPAANGAVQSNRQKKRRRYWRRGSKKTKPQNQSDAS